MFRFIVTGFGYQADGVMKRFRPSA